jgi:hypothetical protein
MERVSRILPLPEHEKLKLSRLQYVVTKCTICFKFEQVCIFLIKVPLAFDNDQSLFV